MNVPISMSSPPVPPPTNCVAGEDLKSLLFESYVHSNLILKGMNQLREKQLLFDITIETTEGKSFQVRIPSNFHPSSLLNKVFLFTGPPSHSSVVQ